MPTVPDGEFLATPGADPEASGWSRRHLLAGASAAGLCAPALLPGLAFGRAARRSPGQDAVAPRFATKRDELLALVRVQGDAAGKPAPWWYTGYIYGLLPGEQPRKLVRFEGCEINLFTSKADGSFVLTARTTSFFQDVDTEVVLETWRNPYTNEDVAVRANVLAGAGGSIWSEAGIDPQLRPGADSGGLQPLHSAWTAYGPWVWMRHDRVYPPGLPSPMGESSATLVQRRELDDRRLTSVPALFSSTYMAPWPAWMNMTGKPGHVIWHADGLKIESVEDLPTPYLERIRRLHPGQLRPVPG